jgi:hypothetical protein
MKGGYMVNTSNSWVSYATLIVSLILLVGSFVWFAPKQIPTVEYPNADDIASRIVVPANDNTEVLAAIADVKTSLSDVKDSVTADEDWEVVAEQLATTEWTDKSYKAIYEFIDEEFRDIDEREDIIYVRVKESEVTDADKDDQDAFVTQNLKVKYETDEGEEVVRYITVETVINDGEIDEQEFSETR